jgi:hypothetical protein
LLDAIPVTDRQTDRQTVRRRGEMMQQQMAAYASNTISTDLIQKVFLSSLCRPSDAGEGEDDDENKFTPVPLSPEI